MVSFRFGECFRSRLSHELDRVRDGLNVDVNPDRGGELNIRAARRLIDELRLDTLSSSPPSLSLFLISRISSLVSDHDDPEVRRLFEDDSPRVVVVVVVGSLCQPILNASGTSDGSRSIFESVQFGLCNDTSTCLLSFFVLF